MFINKSSQLSRIVLYQNLGFLSIMVICYLNELLKLPQLIFSNHPFAFVHQRSTLEILLVLAVWFIVSNSTRRVMERVKYLEQFMRVCSWCRQINYNNEWMPLEKFMQMGFDTPTTHGICSDCLRRQQAAAERAKQARKNNAGGKAPPPAPQPAPKAP
jgi:hypothetical protein